MRFAGAAEAPLRPLQPPRIMTVANVAASPPPMLVPCTPETLDISMSLDGGRYTDLSGLGNSKHASPRVRESSLPSLFAPLPPTASSVMVDMMDVLSDIAAGRSSPLSDSSTSSIKNIPTRPFHFEGATDYTNLLEVARDIRSVGECNNEILEALRGIADHVIVLERMCQGLQKIVDELEDADDVSAYGESALALPPTDDAPWGKKRCRNRNRSRKRRSDSADTPATGTSGPCGPPPPPSPAAPVTTPQTIPGPPLVPSDTRPVTSGPAACVPGSWVEVVKRKAPACASRNPQLPALSPPPSVSPSPITACDRHSTLRFATRCFIAFLQGAPQKLAALGSTLCFRTWPRSGVHTPTSKKPASTPISAAFS